MRQKKINAEKNQEGSAVIIVMCVLCVLVALALSMIFAAYQVYSHVQKSATQEQCKQSVITFNKELEKDITASGTIQSNSIRGYIRDVVLTGRALETNDNGTDNRDTAGVMHEVSITNENEEAYGDLTLNLYFQYEDEEKRTGAILYTVLSCSYRGEQYRETRSYVQSDGTWQYEATPGGVTSEE